MLIIFLILVTIAIFIKRFINNVFVEFEVTSINLKTIKIKDVLLKGRATTKLNYNVIIENRNNVKVAVKNIFITLYYKGNEIGRSEVAQDIVLNKFKKTEFSNTLNITLDKTSLQIVQDALSKEPIKLEYKVDFKVFGLKRIVEDSYVIRLKDII